MKELAYVNGLFSPIVDARVSIEDRGFQFGDGVYEVVAVYNGRPFLLDRHLRRLRNSLDAISLRYDFSAAPLEPIILDGLRQSQLRDALVYIQITRGAAPRSHVVPKNLKPTVVMTFKPLPEVSADLRRRGASLMTTPDSRWSRCFVKAITLLPNVLARNEAVDRGFDDAVFVAADGTVRECTSANIFLIRDDTVVTPPLTESILHGVTQSFLMDCADGIGMRVTEEAFDVPALSAANEVFISSTSLEVLAVTRLDGRPIADGTLGKRTIRLWEEFRARSRA